jgi:hypothetical protein
VSDDHEELDILWMQAHAPSVCSYARYLAGEDIPDLALRDAIVAKRSQHGPEMWIAHEKILRFERRHPGVRKNWRVWTRMRWALERREAWTMDQAYVVATMTDDRQHQRYRDDEPDPREAA